MEKLIELLGKIIQPLLSSKTLWFIVVAAAIFTLALLLLPQPILEPLGVWAFAQNPDNRPYIGLLALASIVLILVKAAIWVFGLLRDKFFV
jgi:hypothetical protein